MNDSAQPRLYPVQVDGKWGYIGAGGSVVVAPRYDLAFPFRDGRAVVGQLDPQGRKDAQTFLLRRTMGVIDPAGSEVVPPKYDWMRETFAGGRVGFRQGKKWGYLDAGGTVTIEAKFDGAWEFSEGVATVLVNRRTQAAIDEAGAVLFERPGGTIGPCREGLMASETKRQWSYVDRSGATAFEVACSAAGEFSDGLAKVLVKGAMGYIDRTGAIVIDPRFVTAQAFSEGLAAVELPREDPAAPQQFGYIDRRSEFVIPPTLRWAQSFCEGLAAASPGEAGQIGYIDRSGAVVIPPIRCELADGFRGGLAMIQGSRGEVGYINRAGEFVWPLRA